METHPFEGILPSLIRPIFIPTPGKVFFRTDLSQVEFRSSLYTSGDMKQLAEVHDPQVDSYIKSARNIFSNPNLEKPCFEREVAKTGVLAMQYGAGPVGIYESFMKKMGYIPSGYDINKGLADFKRQYPLIVAQWKVHDLGLKQAYASRKYTVKLSTGRELCFKNLAVRPVKNKKTGIVQNQMSYDNFGVVSSIWGSKAFQNVAQSEARDMLVVKLLHFIELCPDAKFILTVHDECVFEVDKGADVDYYHNMWMKAGEEEIQKFWPGMLLDSESEITEEPTNFYYK